MLRFELVRRARGPLVPADPLVYLLVLDEVRFLPEGLRTHVAPERLLARVGSQVHFYIRLVQEPSIAYTTAVDRLLLP